MPIWFQDISNTALVKLIEKWITRIDDADIVGTLFIDFRKASGTVDHSLLIKARIL